VRKQELDLEGGERVSKRDYERLERQLQTRDREASLLREQIEDLQSLQRQNESMQITIDLMKAQLEREKRMVEEKVREATAGSAREVEMKRQVEELQGKLNSYEEERTQLVGTLRNLREKVGGIEKHFGNEILVRLQALR